MPRRPAHPKRACVRPRRPAERLPDLRRTCRDILRALRRQHVALAEEAALPDAHERLPIVVVDVQHDFLPVDLLHARAADDLRHLALFLVEHPPVQAPPEGPSVHERLLDSILAPLLRPGAG